MAARNLPARPNLAQYKKQAKELLKRWKASDPETTSKLADAQHAIAREHGFDTWKKFTEEIARRTGSEQKAAIWKSAEDALIARDATMLDRLLRAHEKMFCTERPQSSWFGGLTPDYKGGDARAIIVRNHFFETSEQFIEFDAQMKDASSPVARFERAVDAIVSGDSGWLERALREHPELVRVRSARTHHSMLLHYVGANGVEGFRQRTPKNAVQVAELLLRAGAEVDAVADMYGGATTLGLVATSIHPKLAGVQEALIDALLAHGARMDRRGAAGNAASLVNGCLANGRGEAAEFLARRGAPLDLEGAAGVGRLDVVTSFFEADGSLKPTATPAQRRDGFTWACEYGRTDVVEFLLDHGAEDRGIDQRIEDGERLPRPHGQTGLHWAAYGGHVDTVEALLARHASVHVRDQTYGATPLGWALYAWGSEPQATPGARYHHVVALLVTAGAEVEPRWLADDKIREDPGMHAALTGGLRPA
jgi:ankyrin repeat protein